MGIYINMEMPEGGYRTIEIGYDADGHPMAIADGGDVFDVIPVADVRPVVRGRWVEEAVYYADDGNPCSAFFCNQCSTPFVEKYNFCPNCGADMRPEPTKEE